jgi:hypothetical protein
LRDREIYPDACGNAGMETAEWRIPVHRSESPAGYSSAGCSPAAPASASPVTHHRSSIPIRRLAVMPCRAGRILRQRGCHLYFARRVTFLPCADIPFFLNFATGVGHFPAVLLAPVAHRVSCLAADRWASRVLPQQGVPLSPRRQTRIYLKSVFDPREALLVPELSDCL